MECADAFRDGPAMPMESGLRPRAMAGEDALDLTDAQAPRTRDCPRRVAGAGERFFAFARQNHHLPGQRLEAADGVIGGHGPAVPLGGRAQATIAGGRW